MYQGTNEDTTASQFYQRRLFRDTAYDGIRVGNLIDLWVDHPNYGKVSEYGHPLIVRSDSLKQVRFASNNETIFALNFVADAWDRLFDKVLEHKNNGQIKETSPFYNLRVHVGYSSLNATYDKYIKEALYRPLSEAYLTNGRKRAVKDFETFLGVVSPLFRHIASEMPITKCGFLESTFSSIGTSGLSLELAPASGHSEDFGKFDTYIQDDFFEMYAKLAAEEGFYIDKNAPWRLLANLRAPAMRQRMAKYENPDYALYDGVFYDYAHSLDMLGLKHYLYGMYEAFQEANPYVFTSRQTSCESTKPISYPRTSTTFATEFGGLDSNGVFGPRWSLVNYYHLRLLERGITYSAQAHRSNLQIILSTYAGSDYETALDLLQQEFVGPPTVTT